MLRALLAALFVGSLSLGFVGCGDDTTPQAEKKATKPEIKKGPEEKKAPEEAKKEETKKDEKEETK